MTFSSIQNEDVWDQKSICESIEFPKVLEDEEFVFLLHFFNDLFKHIEILFGTLQFRRSNTLTTEGALTNFENAICHQCDNVSKYFDNIHHLNASASKFTSRAKKPRRETAGPTFDSLEKCATQSCNKMIKELKSNLQSSEIFRSFVIVNPANFKLYRKSFPTKHVEEILTNYAMLNEDKLKTEFSVLYANDTFAEIPDTNKLMTFISEHDLDETFLEVSKLLEIVTVTPISTADSERSFSTLKPITTFLRNTMSQKRLNSLTCLSIHKQYISQIKDFNKKVIDNFAQIKNRRAEYLYK